MIVVALAKCFRHGARAKASLKRAIGRGELEGDLGLGWSVVAAIGPETG